MNREYEYSNLGIVISMKKKKRELKRMSKII